jgi:hypothetical protein
LINEKITELIEKVDRYLNTFWKGLGEFRGEIRPSELAKFRDQFISILKDLKELKKLAEEDCES